MIKYIPGSGRFDGSVSFGIDQNLFGNIELVSTLDRIVQHKEDTTWAIGMGGSIFAAPVVKDGVVYFGACDKNFYAVDAETGKGLWRFPTEGVILSTAAIDENAVYFGSFDGCLYAISPKGKLLWKFRAGDKIYSDPFVWKNGVYFGSHNGKVYAVDKYTGTPAWTFSAGGPVSSSPLVHEGVLYIGSNDMNLYAIDAEAGKLKWKFPTSGAVRYRPAEWDSKIIFGSLDGLMRAVDMNGRLVWSFATNDGIGTYPNVFNGKLFFGSRDMNYYAVEGNGKLLWKYRCRGYPNEILVFSGLAYLGCCENNLFVLDEKTGRELWTFPTNGFVLRPVENEGRIFFGSWDCNLYCITPDGKLIWKFSTSLSYQSPLQPEEESKLRTFEVVWAPEIETEEKPERKEKELSDYGAMKSEYASGISSDYLGKKKRGYV